MKRMALLLDFLLIFFIVSTAFAGIRGSGPYSGVVIFDRWGGCTLYSGVYVMYISEEIKEKLRPYANEAVEINATDVYQAWNPGDGLIKAFDSVEYLSGSGKQPYGVWVGGVQLKNLIACKEGQKPAVLMQVINTVQRPIEIQSTELAPTLLTAKVEDESIRLRCPADGPSAALVTRQAFWIADKPRWQGDKWTIGEENALPRIFKLQPGEITRIKITFDLPPGEYEFLSGYGGGVHAGKCIAGNRVAFDVDENGQAKMPRPAYNPEQWNVNNDLPQEAIDHRDELLSKADQQIRGRILQLAETYPQLKNGIDYQKAISGKSGIGRIYIYLGHRAMTMLEDSTPEKDRFQVWVSLHEPPAQVSQIEMAPLYPNLGLVGNIRAVAGDKQLEAVLKKVVEDALKPLRDYNDSLNSETNNDGAQSGRESRIVFRDLSTNENLDQ